MFDARIASCQKLKCDVYIYIYMLEGNAIFMYWCVNIGASRRYICMHLFIFFCFSFFTFCAVINCVDGK